MKVYEGWKVEKIGSKRYKTKNTLYFAGYEKPRKFSNNEFHIKVFDNKLM
ncbi:hypothetical protein [Clostridium taeniosporum]|nr:hypothetical protein [Clostridium taeniosporum]